MARKSHFGELRRSNSPLQYDIPMLWGMIEFAKRLQPVMITPFTLAGAMAPVTLAGALTQQNAEALAGLAFVQMVRRGTPVMYGGFTATGKMDIKARQLTVAQKLCLGYAYDVMRIEPVKDRRRRRPTARTLLGLAVALMLLAGCASSTSLVRYCCYDSDAALTRIDGVQFVMTGGSESSFDDVYAGFQPQETFFTKPFPFRKVNIALITYDALAPVLPLYDANGDGRLQEPEITVMYIREGAIGMGHEVDHLAVNGKRASAITVARADVGGLINFIDGHRDAMTPQAQAIFRDLERVGLDKRQEGSEGADRQIRRIRP